MAEDKSQLLTDVTPHVALQEAAALSTMQNSGRK